MGLAEPAPDVLQRRGFVVAKLDDLINWGDPDKVGERLTAELTPGLDGFVISAPLNGHIPGRVELLGRTAAAVVG